MTADGPSPDRRLRLRYDGRCRLCGVFLAAGTSAIHERSSRTVRCIACTPAITVDESSLTEESRSPFQGNDELRLRGPASAVIAQTLRVQAGALPRPPMARLFGRSPLSAESRSWYLGAVGELEVGRVLDNLGTGWWALHAIPVGTAGSDIDHLVIGPAGVFTINSKFHEGKNIWVGARRLLVNGQRTDHLRNAAFEARRVAKILTSALGEPVVVGSIIAVVAARRITFKEQPADVTVLSSAQLLRWLHQRPVVLTPSESERLLHLAMDLRTWGSPALEPADLGSFAALRESVSAARQRRRVWASVALLSPLLILAAGCLNQLR